MHVVSKDLYYVASDHDELEMVIAWHRQGVYTVRNGMYTRARIDRLCFNNVCCSIQDVFWTIDDMSQCDVLLRC